MQSAFVDVWANFWPSSFFEQSTMHRRLYSRLGVSERTKLSAASIAAEYRAAGAAKVVISATVGDDASISNDEVAEFVQENADIFVGCASVDPRNVTTACRELDRAVSQLSFRALKMIPYLYDTAPNAACYYPLYAKAVELGIPVLILTGHSAVARLSEYGRPALLDTVALDFPELTIIAGHAGVPWTEELVSLSWKHENVYIDTSGHSPKHYPPGLLQFLRSYGKGKVCFGTGFPLFAPARLAERVRTLRLSDDAEREFLFGVANRIWGWS